MTLYQERSRQNKALSEQQYFDALKQRDRLADGKEKMQIIAPDGQTGRYLISRSDGGVTSNGDKMFNAAPPQDGFVRPSKNPHSNAIALDHRNVKVTQFLPTEETVEESTSNVIFLFRDSETRDGIVYLTFWVGGDRAEPEQIYECAEAFEDTTLEFVYGAIQKTGLNLNGFVVNLILKKVYVAPIPLVDLTEPITYFLYKIEGIDDPDVDTEVLTDDLLVDNVYEGALSLKKQELILPQYPEREIPKLLQDERATLNDRGYYKGIEFGNFAFQYGYFGGFEIAEGTISEEKSGEWNDLNPADYPPTKEFPPQGTIQPSDNLDSIPQFEPDALEYQSEPYATDYDYSSIKYTYDPENPENPPWEPPFTGGQGNNILYTVDVEVTFEWRRIDTLAVIWVATNVWRSTVRGVIRSISIIDTAYKSIPDGYTWWGARDGNIFISSIINGIPTQTSAGANRNGSNSASNLISNVNVFGSPILGVRSDAKTNSVKIVRVVRTDGLPDTDGNLPEPPTTPNTGCIDIDANNFAEIDNPSEPDYRTSETCEYNPFRIRSNKRRYTATFEPLLIPPSDTPTLIPPSITPKEENLIINNPIPPLVDNNLPEELSVNRYTAITGSGIPTSEKITVEYIPPDPTSTPPRRRHLNVDSEFLETDFLAISFDSESFLTKKVSKYPTEISQIVTDIHDADPSSTLTAKDIADQYSTVIGGITDYSYNSFKLDETFFEGDSNTDGKIIFEEQFYLPNYALESTLFIVSKKFDEEGLEITDIGDGDTIDIVQTILSETVENTPLSADFIGDVRGQIVDASAYFEVN